MLTHRYLPILLILIYALLIWGVWSLLLDVSRKIGVPKDVDMKLYGTAMTLLAIFWPITIIAILIQTIAYNIRKLWKH